MDANVRVYDQLRRQRDSVSRYTQGKPKRQYSQLDAKQLIIHAVGKRLFYLLNL
jgi:hypothetical protein